MGPKYSQYLHHDWKVNQVLINIDINVLRVVPPQQDIPQTANINGYVYLNILPPILNMGTGGYPYLNGSVVYAKQNGNFVKFGQSNSLEQYSVAGLNPGTYDITVVRLGYETETRTVVLSSQNLDRKR